jgi:acyl-CoA reductase-like NAD-dependent aldehyde dehydrogenase
MDRHQNYIAGRWTPPTGGSYYQTRNPARPAEALGEFPCSTEEDVDLALAAAETARPNWADTPAPKRAAMLVRFSQLFAESQDELARIVTMEQGKALHESSGEVARASSEASFSAGEALRLSGHTFPSERPGFSCYTILEPLGVVAAITPWNFPVVAPVRKIVPALACGNTVVLKPASLTPWSSVYIAKLAERAGLPAGVLNLVIGHGRTVGDRLISDSRIRGVSFTGSTTVGMRINQRVSQRMAKVQLELGGKNPAIVLDCDDLEGAAREIVAAAFLCSGQRCTALSRVLVEESLADDLVERLRLRILDIRVGDGLDPQTTMGPLVSGEQMQTVNRYVSLGKERGAKLILGGHSLIKDAEKEGYFYAPTLFDHVEADSPLAVDEIFGPVLPVIRVRDAGEAFQIANSTRYGLAASLFTRNQNLVYEFLRRVECGMAHVNHGTASQAHVPFGGVKDSGQGAYSIGPTVKDAFTNIKTVYIKA